MAPPAPGGAAGAAAVNVPRKARNALGRETAAAKANGGGTAAKAGDKSKHNGAGAVATQPAVLTTPAGLAPIDVSGGVADDALPSSSDPSLSSRGIGAETKGDEAGTTKAPRKRNRDSDRTPREVSLNKKLKGDGGPSDEAISLGYDTGTIKHAAFVLLRRSGAPGITVAEIVLNATKEGLYSWGTCKTPNNSVTAALSQDTNFTRVAPSTYALKTQLKRIGPEPGRSSSKNNGGAAAAALGGDGDPPTATSRLARQGGGGAADRARQPFRRTASPASGAWEWLRGENHASTSKAVTPPPGSLKVRLHEDGVRRECIVGDGAEKADALLLDPELASPEMVFSRNPVLEHSPTAREAGSCLFRYPCANPPLAKPEGEEARASPSEGTKRALLWKEEVVASKLERTKSGAKSGAAHDATKENSTAAAAGATNREPAASAPAAVAPPPAQGCAVGLRKPVWASLPAWVLEDYKGRGASPASSVQSAAAAIAV